MFKFHISLIFILFFACSVFSNEADDSYAKAVSSDTIGQREELLEKSLEGYLKIENDNIENGIKNGALYYNIGNCYFILGQLGKAILYYEEASKLLPANENIKMNLDTALKKRTNAYDYEVAQSLKNIFFFHYEISEKNKILILFSLSLLIFILYIPLFKNDILKLRVFLGFSILIYLSFLGSIVFNYYSPTIKGVLVNSCHVYKEPNENYASVTKKPLGEGSRVKIIKLDTDWAMIEFGENKNGYVKRNDLDLILNGNL